MEYVPQLADYPSAFRYATRAFGEGVEAGVFPRERSGPTGGERAFYMPLAGFVTFYPTTGGYWLDLLWVDVDARRRGIGKALMAAVLDHCEGSTIGLGYVHGNDAMAALAASVGFKLEGYYLKHGG